MIVRQADTTTPRGRATSRQRRINEQRAMQADRRRARAVVELDEQFHSRLSMPIDAGKGALQQATAFLAQLACPVCEATGSDPCRTSTGNIAKSPHKLRNIT